MTLVEVLVVVVVVVGLLAAILMPALLKFKAHDQGIACINNLKQIGLATRVWEGDHKETFPMHVARTNGGTMGYDSGPNAFRHFQVMSNELGALKILICPAESDQQRFLATNFAHLSNSNLSYFVGLDAEETNPQGILTGDHNITNGTAIGNGILELTTNSPAGWTAKMHRGFGIIVSADGSVQMTAVPGLACNRQQCGRAHESSPDANTRPVNL